MGSRTLHPGQFPVEAFHPSAHLLLSTPGLCCTQVPGSLLVLPHNHGQLLSTGQAALEKTLSSFCAPVDGGRELQQTTNAATQTGQLGECEPLPSRPQPVGAGQRSLGNPGVLDSVDQAHPGSQQVSTPAPIQIAPSGEDIYISKVLSRPCQICKGFSFPLNCSGHAELRKVGLHSKPQMPDAGQNPSVRLVDRLHGVSALDSFLCTCRLAELSEGVSSLTSLQTFTLSHNALTALPQGVGCLTALQRLDVRCNKLQALPLALGEASSLQELDASDNLLMALPKSLGQLTSLRTLLLDNNKCGLGPQLAIACQSSHVVTCIASLMKPRLVPVHALRTHALAERVTTCMPRRYGHPYLFLCYLRLRGVPAQILRGCYSLARLSLHGNPLTIEQLRGADGFQEFDARRCARCDKQVCAR